jgi:[glutamine synthetase] adenylyltransferase / [glutamine synthetase]-adenylyl-L-tyrosine phosphorylase
MSELRLLSDLTGLPRAFDAEAAQRGRAAWADLAAAGPPARARFARELSADSRGAVLLDALFGNSPFLGQCLLHEPDFAAELLARPLDASAQAVIADMRRAAQAAPSALELMMPLRIARRRFALTVALADLGGAWNVDQVTAALSDFAEAAVGLAAGRLLADAAREGHFHLPYPEDPARGSGYILIGMGKLGARELNYSSDIDLLALYAPIPGVYVGRRDVQDTFVRVTRALVRMLQERTEDGYVFRVDLRLRPDPGATPVALSTLAAENYYESLGQNWERAAMIKARAVAGDIEAGREFLQRLQPFSWRRNLDFAAIEDIQSIKRQIHAHKGHGAVAIHGHNIKLGRGGIREIEFFAQTQQLIAGGRDPRLRAAATCDAIRALAATGRIAPAVADDMIGAYRYLRRLEHRLQMVDDEQTHTLPGDDPGLARIAIFNGDEPADFQARLRGVLETVQRHYDALFARAEPLGSVGSLVFTGTEDDPETIKTLASLGFEKPPEVAATVRGWHHGRYRAMRSERAREKLTAIMPHLLEALSRTASPHLAFMRFDEFLGRLPAGVQLFSLLHANLDLLAVVADVMGTAPRLAAHLSRHPGEFDAMLSGGFFDPLPAAPELAVEAAEKFDAARDFQDMLDVARRWAGDRRLQVGLQLLRGRIDAEGAGRAFANVAEGVLAALLPRVEAEFALTHGKIKGGRLAVIGLGRLGSGEMTVESDLDLILVYGHDPVDASDGRKPLPPSHYYGRLCQRVINAITAPTSEGPLYDVDMRLRPSGNAGPVAVSLEGFVDYQRNAAWTWEHMALTRARVVAGPPAFVENIRIAIRDILCRPRDPAKLLADVASMRATIAAERGTADPWAVKHVPGGLIDIEFICQYLQLRHAAAAPAVLHPHTPAALRALAEAGFLDRAVAGDLLAAHKLLDRVLALTRLCQAENFDPAAAALGLKKVLARAVELEDFALIEPLLVATENRVAEHFRRLVGRPAV